MFKYVDLWDMDGTIVDSSHRYQTAPCGTKIDLDHWRENSKYAYSDKLLPMALVYRARLSDPSVYTAIATARVISTPDRCFVRDFLGEPRRFIHRLGDDDQRKGVELKYKGIRPLFNLKPFENAVVRFYEDNLTYLHGVCDLLEADGIPCERYYVPSVQGH